MKLYLMRHGKAMDAALGYDDFQRILTEKGVRRVGQMSRWLARMGVAPRVIYASPRVRAQQTALILGEALGKKVITREEVNFEFQMQHVETLIQGYEEDAEIFFVGHNPSLSEVARDLTGANISMDVGSVLCAHVSPGSPLRGELGWYMNWACIKAGQD